MGKTKDKPKIKKVPKNDTIDTDNLNGIDYPVFCFRYLQDISIKECEYSKFFYNFLFRLKKLSELGWKEIRKADRHGFGMEKIPINKIKAQELLSIITPDVEYLSVFRANGDNRPFIGIQNRSVFHVLFVETNFGDIYEH